MAIRVGINGFGRIGRTVFRIISQNPDRFELCGINLRNLNMEYMAYTALYDSVHGHFPGTIEAGSQHLKSTASRSGYSARATLPI